MLLQLTKSAPRLTSAQIFGRLWPGRWLASHTTRLHSFMISSAGCRLIALPTRHWHAIRARKTHEALTIIDRQLVPATTTLPRYHIPRMPVPATSSTASNCVHPPFRQALLEEFGSRGRARFVADGEARVLC